MYDNNGSLEIELDETLNDFVNLALPGLGESADVVRLTGLLTILISLWLLGYARQVKGRDGYYKWTATSKLIIDFERRRHKNLH